MRKKQFSYFSFQNFFGFWAKNFSDFQPKNFNKLSKLPSACPEEHSVTSIFLKKFWMVLDLLQKPLAWFSNFYLRVQSKNSVRKNFFFFFTEFFFRILSEISSDFWPENFKKLSKLPCACADEQIWAWKFFQNFELFRIFCRNVWHGSQKSI